MSEAFDSVRVIDKPTAIKLSGLSPRTWDRLSAKGETPPITRLSARRVGYRLSDFKDWLDARRLHLEDDHDRHLRGPRPKAQQPLDQPAP